MENLEIYQEERPWGNFRQFTHDVSSTVKILTINSGQSVSLQSHTKRTEFWKIIKGDGIVEIGDVKYNAKEGDEFNILTGTKHRIGAGDSGIVVLEIARGGFDENDIVRYEDKYGRA